ncbi:class I SAM-dependent methyltransferase [Candidatus Leptofilum sp.]|uniref:class I SAM-dependent methyltransferase n=1 Tax=Candidatus Leptofilum sp. TaxID=3241576 RepID=UPI003B595B91
MSVYDKHYQQESLFGEPYPQFVAFMAEWEPKGTVLDVGCGQGRDALFLAKQGYQVTGIDNSKLGISQMLATAEGHGLSLNGIVADFYDYTFNQSFDVIVLDSILHFQKKDFAKEMGLLTTLSGHLNPGGLFCCFIHQSKAKEKHLKQFFTQNHPRWQILVSDYVSYTYKEPGSDFRSQFNYFMYFAQRPLTMKMN